MSAAKKTSNPITTEVNLDITATAGKLEDVISDSILFTAVPKPKIDQVRDYYNVNCPEKPKNLLSIADVLSMTTTLAEYHQQVKAHFKRKDISEIEKLTRGQNNNEQWFAFRKGVITGSRTHEVKTKMTKFTEGDGSSTNLWSLFKVSGRTFVNPNIPALKYGREMEINAVNEFQKMHAISHKNIKVEQCGLFLLPEKPFIGCSPEGIVFCCCGKSCLKIKCPYSINCASPTDPRVTLSYRLKGKDDKVALNRNHQYYTQCQMQMAVTGTNICHFFVWTPHGHYHEKIEFNLKFWENIVPKFEKFYEDQYLKYHWSLKR